MLMHSSTWPAFASFVPYCERALVRRLGREEEKDWEGLGEGVRSSGKLAHQSTRTKGFTLYNSLTSTGRSRAAYSDFSGKDITKVRRLSDEESRMAGLAE